MALEITDANFSTMVSASAKPVVLDFWAPWCGPCRMVGPIIDEISKELEGKVVVGKMNVDENNIIPSEQGIRNIPTILIFKDGKVVEKQVGACSKADLLAKINSIL